MTIDELIQKKTDFEMELMDILNDHISSFQKRNNAAIDQINLRFIDISDIEKMEFLISDVTISLKYPSKGGDFVTVS